MIIERIRLKNIRSYESEDIKFPRGTVLLAGNIGAGKTSLLLAVEFALFGLKGSELGGSALLRHGANEGLVQLEFSLGSKEYTIVRTLKRKAGKVRQNNGFVLVNGKKTEMTAVELKSFVLRALGYPEELVTTRKSVIYRYTVYTPQEEMKRIINEDSETRLQVLRKIFNIDKYKRVRENTSLAARVVKQRIREIESSTEDLPSLEKELKGYNNEAKEANERLAVASSNCLFLKKRLEEEGEKLRELETKRDTLREKIKGLQLMDEKLKGINNQIIRIEGILRKNKGRSLEIKREYEALTVEEGLPTPEEVKHRIEEIETQLRDIRRKETEATTRINSERQNLERLMEEVSNLEARIKGFEAIKKRVSELRALVDSKEGLQGALRAARDALEKHRIELQELFAKDNQDLRMRSQLESASECPLCKSPLKPEHRARLLKEIENRLNSRSKVLTDLEEKIKRLEEKSADLEKKLEIVDVQNAELQRLEGKLANLKEISEELLRKRNAVAQSKLMLKDLEKQSSKGKSTNEAEARLHELREQERQVSAAALKLKQKEILKKEFSRIKNENSELQKELGAYMKSKLQLEQKLLKLTEVTNSFQRIDEKYKLQRRVFEETQSKEKEASIKRAEIEKEIEKINQYIASLKAKIEEKTRKRKKLQKKYMLVKWLEGFFSPLTENIERHVMLSIYQEFNELFTIWFNMLVDDPQLQARLDEDFTPIVTQNGYETLAENLSGGERTSLALAYRLALNKVINDITTNIKTKDIIILDEPTEGFSSEQLDNVRRVIEELNMHQVIIVSHEAKIESFVEHVIYIEKQDGVSRVVG